MIDSSIKNVADRLKKVVAPPTRLQAVRSGSTTPHTVSPVSFAFPFLTLRCVSALVSEKEGPYQQRMETGHLFWSYCPRAIRTSGEGSRGQVATHGQNVR
jgi:hypothetical protein